MTISAASCTEDGARTTMLVIAVAAALGGLEIVALGGLDAAKPGPAAHHVHNQRRAAPRPRYS